MGGTQVGLEFQCDVCNLHCTSKEQLDDHISESKHKQQIEAEPYDPTPAQSMGRVDSVHRRPLLSFPLSGYKLCPHIQVGRPCIYGDYCTCAHSQGELDEWNSQLQIVSTPPIDTDTVMFHGGGLPPYSPPVALTTTMPGAGPVSVGMGGAPTSLVPGETFKPHVSGLDDLKDERAQESQDFAFLLRTRIASQHKQNQDVQGFEVSRC